MCNKHVARNSLTVSLLSPERAFAVPTEGTGSMNSAGFHLNSEGQEEGQGGAINKTESLVKKVTPRSVTNVDD